MAKFSVCHAYYEISMLKVSLSNNCTVTIFKKQVTSKWRWKIDVDAGLVFILNIDTRSQFPEKRKVVRGETRSW